MPVVGTKNLFIYCGIW